MASSEWVDVRGPSVELAVQAGLEELGLSSTEDAEVEVLQEPSRGFLGMGGQDAVVRVRPQQRSRSRAGSGKRPRSGGSRGSRNGKGSSGAKDSGGSGQRSSSRGSSGSSGGSGKGGGTRNRRSGRGESRRPSDRPDDREVISVDEQASEISRFLTGFLEAFGLEGSVETRIEEDVIYADVTGEQTEALVGQKGAILQSVLELCRTIVQRKTQQGARIRLDIAGYTERRREALRIYTRRLADKVLAEGGEIMLEPMNAADRKVVHDSVVEIDGVRSYSEGEEPHRSVIVSAEDE